MKLQTRYCLTALMLFFVLGFIEVKAQDVAVPKAQQRRMNLEDSLKLAQLDEELDSMQIALLERVKDSIESLKTEKLDSAVLMGKMTADSISGKIKKKDFIPDPKKSLWFAIAFPGGGQIYNRKYWKLPIVYGGFLGCYYALTWNNGMYRDYSQAYMDLMSYDPQRPDPTKMSFVNWLGPNRQIDSSNLSRFQELFKSRKDYYRRYRDLSFFIMLGVYALSVIDAYVDAELSSFDISPDLSMKIKPSVINDGNKLVTQRGLKGNSYGLQCSFDF